MAEKKSETKHDDGPAAHDVEPAEQPKELGAEQVDEALAEEQEQGFRGTKVDPEPNESYTVKGVTSK